MLKEHVSSYSKEHVSSYSKKRNGREIANILALFLSVSHTTDLPAHFSKWEVLHPG